MGKVITDIKQLDLGKRYSYTDYLTWQFDEMVELIKGKIFKMSPAPSRQHQEISGNLYLAIGVFLKGKKCNVYHAPFDVRLPLPSIDDKKIIFTVVQPDISVICDSSKLDQKGCNGAPDWIIEILSPATSKKDLNEKFDIYEKAGVREYWVVHPTDGTVIPYRLNDQGEYEIVQKTPFAKGEKIQVGILPDLIIDLDEIFDFD